jgi:hypothetical protein
MRLSNAPMCCRQRVKEGTDMSEPDKLKDGAEKEAAEHPERISEGEQAIEKKLGMNTDAEQASQHDQNTAPQDAG